MCFPLLNHGSCILTTSQNQISSHTNDIFLWPPSSSAAFGACGSQMRGAAASLQAELPPPRHVPGIALLQQGKGRQMTAQQLHMHGLQSPALRRLTGSIPSTSLPCRTTRQAPGQDPICKILGMVRRKDGQPYLLSFFTAFDVFISPDCSTATTQRHPEACLTVSFPDLL